MTNDYLSIDGHKLHLHPERVSQWMKDPLNTYPIYVEISPVGHCNHRCTFCAVDYLGYKPRSLDTEMLIKRLYEMGHLGIKSIMYAGEGEPMLHKDIVKIVNETKLAKIDCAFTTNGTLMTRKFIEGCLHSIDWIKISLNAGTKEAYERIHKAKNKDWDLVWSNIHYAVEYRNTNKYNAILGVQALMLPDNTDTLINLVKLAKASGLDYCVIKPYSQHHSSITHKYEYVKYKEYNNLCDELSSYSDTGFDVIVRKASMTSWDQRQHTYTKCNATPTFWAYIMSTGDLYTCSAYLSDDRFKMGNIIKEPFRNSWTGLKRQKHIEEMKSLDISQCRVNCRMNKVNQYLDQIVTGVEHQNFI